MSIQSYCVDSRCFQEGPTHLHEKNRPKMTIEDRLQRVEDSIDQMKLDIAEIVITLRELQYSYLYIGEDE